MPYLPLRPGLALGHRGRSGNRASPDAVHTRTRGRSRVNLSTRDTGGRSARRRSSAPRVLSEARVMVPTTWKGRCAHRLDAHHLGGPLAGPGHLRACDPHRPANDLVVLAGPVRGRVLAGEEGLVPAVQVRRPSVLPHAPALLDRSAHQRGSREGDPLFAVRDP